MAISKSESRMINKIDKFFFSIRHVQKIAKHIQGSSRKGAVASFEEDKGVTGGGQKRDTDR